MVPQERLRRAKKFSRLLLTKEVADDYYELTKKEQESYLEEKVCEHLESLSGSQLSVLLEDMIECK